MCGARNPRGVASGAAASVARGRGGIRPGPRSMAASSAGVTPTRSAVARINPAMRVGMVPSITRPA
ncbi:hypothetical protein D7D52_01795 [Nocardia yunnanensis]|uniref:Uncharacterized protein n=1 Tax=Nocardia yunnanensis TaxID=2382165 RepID=A0A386Z571_9NOCA|nr:hypothetical protein D7D52_01795 [Nocardia yunnanensis]